MPTMKLFVTVAQHEASSVVSDVSTWTGPLEITSLDTKFSFDAATTTTNNPLGTWKVVAPPMPETSFDLF